MQNSIVYGLMALASVAQAHMDLSYPPPLRSKFNSHATNIDYSMTAPLSGAAQFPCKGYLSDLGTPAGASVATWAAGAEQTFTVEGGATHNGGSCQAAISTDQGATFKVMASYIGSCPLSSGESFKFTVPADTPAGDAVFAWTWLNKVGNREYYMNCAAVTIGASSAKKRASDAAFASLPSLFVANLGNGCTTIEGQDVTFPDPGPNVIGTPNSASPGFTGTCAAVAGNGGGSSGSSGSGSGSGSGSSSAAPVSSPAAVAPSVVATTLQTLTSATAAASLPGGVFVTTGPAPVATSTSVVVPVEATSTTAASVPASTGSSGSTGATGAQTGACTSEGMFNCISGSSYQQCASGVWSVVMPLAAGTKCTAGQTMALDIGFASRKRSSMRRHLAKHISH